MKIVIDGDGSPVKNATINIALSFGLPVVIVTSVDHFSVKEYPKEVTFIYVDKGADSADFRIIRLIQPADILITQDYGLASLVLPKKARVLHQLGFEYTPDTIDQLLEQRYRSAKVRKSGGRTKGPKPYTQTDEENFKVKLIQVINETEMKREVSK